MLQFYYNLIARQIEASAEPRLLPVSLMRPQVEFETLKQTSIYFVCFITYVGGEEAEEEEEVTPAGFIRITVSNINQLPQKHRLQN